MYSLLSRRYMPNCNIPRSPSLSIPIPRSSPTRRLLQRRRIIIMCGALSVLLLPLLLLLIPLSITLVSKPILMALSHSTDNFILSRSSCLRRSTLSVSLSCSVMSSVTPLQALSEALSSLRYKNCTLQAIVCGAMKYQLTLPRLILAPTVWRRTH